MRVLIVDPGMINENGHHFSTNLNIYKKFKDSGFQVKIISSVVCSKELSKKIQHYNLDVEKIFSSSPYNKFAENNDINIHYYMIQKTVDDIKKFKSHNGLFDIVIWVPTTGPVQLISAVKEKLGHNQFFLLDPYDSNFSNISITLYQIFKEQIEECEHLNFYIYAQYVKKLFQPFLNLKITKLPFMSFSRFLKKKNQPFKLGIFGLDKVNDKKKYENLIDLMSRNNCEYAVHDPKKILKNNFFEKNYISLKNTTEFFNYQKDFAKKISEFSLVLYLYDPKKYQNILSGIVCETIATGRPMLLPHKNRPTEQAKKLNSIITYDWEKFETIDNGLNKFKNFEEYFSRNAQIASKEWSKNEGLDNFVKQIMKFLESNN